MKPLTRGIGLWLVLAAAAGCRSQGAADETAPSPPDTWSHEGVVALAAHGDGWIGMGTTTSADPDQPMRSWWLKGPVAPSRTPPLDGVLIRALARLDSDRFVAVGEVATQPNGGPLGHPLYRGVMLTLQSSGGVLDRKELGTEGATGLTDVAVVAGQIHAVGVRDGGIGWWVSPKQQVDLRLNRVAGIRGDGTGVVIYGQVGSSTTEVGVATVVAYAADGSKRWQWSGAPHSELYAVHADTQGGWLGIGWHNERAWSVSLDGEGKQQSSHLLEVPAKLSQALALGVNRDGAVMSCGVWLDEGNDSHLWCMPMGLDGSPSGPLQNLGPGRVTSVAFSEGTWWVGGQSQQPDSPLRAKVWQLTEAGALQKEVPLPPASGQ